MAWEWRGRARPAVLLTDHPHLPEALLLGGHSGHSGHSDVRRSRGPLRRRDNRAMSHTHTPSTQAVPASSKLFPWATGWKGLITAAPNVDAKFHQKKTVGESIPSLPSPARGEPQPAAAACLSLGNALSTKPSHHVHVRRPKPQRQRQQPRCSSGEACPVSHRPPVGVPSACIPFLGYCFSAEIPLSPAFSASEGQGCSFPGRRERRPSSFSVTSRVSSSRHAPVPIAGVGYQYRPTRRASPRDTNPTDTGALPTLPRDRTRSDCSPVAAPSIIRPHLSVPHPVHLRCIVVFLAFNSSMHVLLS